MLWIKSLHIIFMVTWFAGLFYLPRLFVYHAMSDDRPGIERFKVMERKLFYGIMTPGAVLTIVFGVWLWLGYGFSGGWLHAKLTLVAVLIAYHFYCSKLLADFKHDRNQHGHVFYRWFNEIPVVILIVVKP
jgi:putative membrane protein